MGEALHAEAVFINLAIRAKRRHGAANAQVHRNFRYTQLGVESVRQPHGTLDDLALLHNHGHV